MVRNFRISKALRNYLMMLLVWDTILLLSSICMYCLANILALMNVRYAYLGHTMVKKRFNANCYAFFQLASMGPGNTSLCASIWMVVTITVARFRAIHNPFATHIGRKLSGLSQGNVNRFHNKMVATNMHFGLYWRLDILAAELFRIRTRNVRVEGCRQGNHKSASR